MKLPQLVFLFLVSNSISSQNLKNQASLPGNTPVWPKELDTYISRALVEWKLPGIGIAVVKDGKVVVAKGYGVRELGKPQPIDENTIFDIASVTKTFTASGIACLVDEKKMNWDDPVKKYIPTIEFPDPYLSSNITIRDLLSHRTGLSASNSAMFLARVDRLRLLELVKNLDVESPLRSQWIYSNLGFTIAGEAGVRASGKSWQDLITEKFIIPLGMTRTTADFAGASKMDNLASGHSFYNGIQVPISRERETVQRTVTEPAGAVQSSMADLARWMIFQLGDGTYEGKRILTQASLDEIHSPQIAVPTTRSFRSSRQMKYFAAYGLGWQIFDYRGSTMLWHTGNGEGQAAFLAILPDFNLGIAVMVNSWKASNMKNAIYNRIADYYMNLPTRDYVAEYIKTWEESLRRDSINAAELNASQVKNTRPTLSLALYVGVYRDKLGLDVNVTLANDKLQIDYGGSEVAVLKHWHYDTFVAQWGDRTAFVQFNMSPEGKISELSFDIFRNHIVAKRIR